MNETFNLKEWEDVLPIVQYDGNPPILGIKYNQQYETLMNYFRAVVKSGETSDRVFRMTKKVIDHLPSNYNVWCVRRECINQLKINTEDELQYLNQISEGNEKVYQIWEYRRQIIQLRNSHLGELAYLKKVFDQDNKNYHGWIYRTWLCQYFNLYDQELENINYYIEEDIGNNSAWNFRYFLLKNRMNANLMKEELQFVFQQILIKPSNESAWNYLKGWFRSFEFNELKFSQENVERAFLEYDINDYPEISQFLDNQQIYNRFSVQLKINIYLLNADSCSLYLAIDLTESQEKELDTIRQKYWRWFRQNIQKEFKHLLDQ